MKGRVSIGKEEIESLIKERYQPSDNWSLCDIIIHGFDVTLPPQVSRSVEIKSIDITLEALIDTIN